MILGKSVIPCDAEIKREVIIDSLKEGSNNALPGSSNGPDVFVSNLGNVASAGIPLQAPWKGEVEVGRFSATLTRTTSTARFFQ